MSKIQIELAKTEYYYKQAAEKQAITMLKNGELSPKTVNIVRHVRWRRWLRGNASPYMFKVFVDGYFIGSYWGARNSKLTEEELLNVLTGDNIISEGTYATSWRLNKFHAFNLETYGMSVGSCVTVKPGTYFGGPNLVGFVEEFDTRAGQETDVLSDYSVYVKFKGYPQLVFMPSELQVISHSPSCKKVLLNLESSAK